MMAQETDWYRIENEQAVASPALLLYEERIEHNLREMLRIAGDPARLRPHVKTHKMDYWVRRQVQLGIRKFKAATIAELEMTLAAGADDVLLTQPCAGMLQAQRVAALAGAHPTAVVSVLIDDEETLRFIAAAAQQTQVTLHAFIDIDVGMGRTGITPGYQAGLIARAIRETPRVQLAGVHAYDGHIKESDPGQRARTCEAEFATLLSWLAEMRGSGLPVAELICGGSPTFPYHAPFPERTLSPGTTLFWDAGYAQRYPDLSFLPAALVLCRVVSKPQQHRLTLDLGCKAIASEQAQPRALFPQLEDREGNPLLHSEEQMVIEALHPERFAIGDALYAIPRHICPTVALYDEAYLVRERRIVDTLPIPARQRRMTF